MPRLRAGSLFLVSLMMFVPLYPGLAVPEQKVPERLVAVGDVHGDFDDFCLILKRAGLFNEQNHWMGATTTMVQTGDVIDRGPKSREAMDLLMRLEKEATDAGGRVVPLLGNHEVMNIIGDLRYVPAEGYGEFADADSEKRRQSAYQDYAKWYSNNAKRLAALKQPPKLATQEEWMAAHPPGFVEYGEAFSPRGPYGKWLRTHDAVAQVGSTLLLHGGIAPSVASMRIDQINAQVRRELEEFDKTTQELVSRKVILPFFTLKERADAVQAELLTESNGAPIAADYRNRLVHLLSFNDWLCMKDDGPLWFRAYDQWPEEEGVPQVDKVLAAYKARHLVVAHTVQKGSHIRSRFNGKVFLIDTGMVYKDKGGQPSVLDIQGGKFTALYLDGQEVLLDETTSGSQEKQN